MARLHGAIIATALLLAVGVGECSNGNAASTITTEAEVLFWRSVLPDSPVPESILKLLHHETSYVNEDGKTDAQGFSVARVLLFYDRYKHASLDDSTTAHYLNMARGLTLFFHEEALQVGMNMTVSFPPAASAPLGLLPRSVADSIPFSTSSLPSALAQLGIAKGSVLAAKMHETLVLCEGPTLTGETKFCATSLEALVEGAMAVLGTRNIRPVTSNLPSSGTPRETYTIRGVRQVDGSSFVSCHETYYAYTVYVCHDPRSVRTYMVDMEAGHSGMPITVAIICHTDTSQWDPEHISFKLLGSKPGGAPICHYLPYGHMFWVNKADDLSF